MANTIHMEKRNHELVTKFKEVYGYTSLEGTLDVIFDFVRDNEFALVKHFEKKLEEQK